MAQSIAQSNIDSRVDDSTTTQPKYRPFHFSAFQNRCQNSNSNSNDKNNSTLPIPNVFKEDANVLVTLLNEHLIVELHNVAQITSTIPSKFLENKTHPDISGFLIDRTILMTFLQEKLINWNRKLSALYPIETSANGNCLLHAVLIAMIGVHDFDLYLRDRLLQYMDENKQILQHYWRTARLQSDRTYGIDSDETKLDKEWSDVCDLVRYQHSQDGRAPTRLKYLEAIHIFSLSNLLRRPIIVLAEAIIRNLQDEEISVNDLYGIYLPVLYNSKDCCREPIVLAYDQYHFCPLISYSCYDEYKHEHLLPLYPSKNHILDQTLLPIRFTNVETLHADSQQLLNQFLRLHMISYYFDGNPTPIQIICAELGNKTVSVKMDFLQLYFRYCQEFFDIQLPKTLDDERREAEKQRLLTEHVSIPIRRDVGGRSIVRVVSTPSPNESPRAIDHEIPLETPRIIDRDVQFRFEMEQKSIRIPIHFENERQKVSPTPKTRMTTLESPLDQCLLCDRLLDDPLNSSYCRRCDADLQSRYWGSSGRTSSRQSFPSAYDFRPKTPRRIICNRCDSVNIQTAALHSNSDFVCSACRQTLLSNRPVK